MPEGVLMAVDGVLLTILLPTFNEEEAICQVLDDILAVVEPMNISYELMVLDDGSTDGTRAACDARPQVKVVTHQHNRGNGAARTTGVKAARGRYVLMMDADGTYPAADIPAMLKEAENADMVIGARTSEKGTLKAVSYTHLTLPTI